MYLKEAQRAFEGAFKGVIVSFKEVSRVLQGRLKGVLGDSEWFKGVSRES